MGGYAIAHPDLYGYLDDFCLARTHAGAFRFWAMPVRWQQAQRVIAMIWERYANPLAALK